MVSGRSAVPAAIETGGVVEQHQIEIGDVKILSFRGDSA
jgi:hypothetical protein